MVVEIDGSILEGGGQILRISIALSVLRQIPIRIQNIRANRTRKGLAPQHLIGIRLAREISEGQLENDVLGSSEITFIPKSIKSGKFIADTPTAGSVALILQVSLPCILFGSKRTYLTIKGGTNADLAPQIDYVVHVLKPMLQKFGVNFNVEIIRRGFLRGNGLIHVTADPVSKLLPINVVDFGDVEKIQGEAFVAGVLPFKLAEEMAQAAENILKKSITAEISIKRVKFKEDEAYGNGSGIYLVAKTSTGCYLNGSYLGKKGLYAKKVGCMAAEILMESLNRKCCVDQNMQDQLLIFMALADGKSRVRVGPITSHTETVIYITELLTKAKFNIINLDDSSNIIECSGIGQQNEVLIEKK